MNILKNKTVVRPCYDIPILVIRHFDMENAPSLSRNVHPNYITSTYILDMYLHLLNSMESFIQYLPTTPSKLLRHTHFFQVTMLCDAIYSQAFGETKTNICFGQINHRICLLKRILIRLSRICSHGFCQRVVLRHSPKRSKYLLFIICVFT